MSDDPADSTSASPNGLEGDGCLDGCFNVVALGIVLLVLNFGFGVSPGDIWRKTYDFFDSAETEQPEQTPADNEEAPDPVEEGTDDPLSSEPCAVTGSGNELCGDQLVAYCELLESQYTDAMESGTRYRPDYGSTTRETCSNVGVDLP